MKTKQPARSHASDLTSSLQRIDTLQLDAVLGGCGCGQPGCNLADGTLGGTTEGEPRKR